MVITNEPCHDGLVDAAAWWQTCSHTMTGVISAFAIVKRKSDVGSVCWCRSNKYKYSNALMKDMKIHSYSEFTLDAKYQSLMICDEDQNVFGYKSFTK